MVIFLRVAHSDLVGILGAARGQSRKIDVSYVCVWIEDGLRPRRGGGGRLGIKKGLRAVSSFEDTSRRPLTRDAV